MPGSMARLAAAAMLVIAASGAAPAAAPQSVDIGLTTHLGDRQQFVDGDRVSFLLSLDRAAHVYLFYLDADANLLQLLPNAQMPGHFFAAGLFMPVPGREQPFQFVVHPPYGEEVLVAFASDSPGLDFGGETLSNGLLRLEMKLEQVERLIRGQSKRLFGRGELVLTTLPAAAAEQGGSGGGG